jgi:hypothetical protein
MSDNVSIAASMASNTGVKYLIENKDRSGFDITPLDPTNNAVDADFDFVFRGQGREAPNRI